MSKPPSTTGRLLDDDMPPPGQTPRPRPTVVPSAPFAPPQRPEPQRLAAPQPRQTNTPVPLQPAQRACYEALALALQEGHVFSAVTGPEGSGKTTVLEAVLADKHDRALRCIRISDPDKVPARLAAQIEQVAYAEAGKPENLERHVVLAIDDAHTASTDLLRCLARLAAMREPGRRVPQVLLVGRPELWTRLATEDYAPLARRLAIRAVLPKLQDEQDPWASLEQEVSQTMSQLRGDGEQLPAQTSGPHVTPLFDRAYTDSYPTTVADAGLPFDPETVPPPTDYALFPDPLPAAVSTRRRSSSRRLLVPLGCLMAAIAVTAFVLSFYDFPGMLDDMPWATNKPAAAFVIPQNNQPGMPQTPAWAQSGSRLAQTSAGSTVSPTLPRGAPPSPTAAPITPSASTSTAALARPVSPAPSAASAAIPSVTTPVTLAAPRPLPAPPSPEPSTPPSSTSIPSLTPAVPATASPIVVATAAPAEPVKPAEPPKPIEAAIKPEPPSPMAESNSDVMRPTVSALVPAPPAAIAPATVAPVPASPAQVAAASPPLSATAQRSGATRPAPIAVVKPAPLPPAIVGLLLRRGEEQLAIGDVSAARLLFERAAESGNAQGAFRLARTYDSTFLPAAEAPLLANRNEARVWYGRAASLGDREAAARLRDLNEGR